MRIKDMFERDIDRDINGVITADENDEAIVEQELAEYVVTNELRGHFATFYDAYDRALDEPTSRIGVWISGFFGSGKSHFLKMLSYLLSNRMSAGRRAVDIIGPRFDNPMLEAKACRAAAVPTEAILFNIDSKGPQKKDKTAILQVFARVFYENLGYYGGDLKLARLERHIDKLGKTEEFRAVYERITGKPWLEDRGAYEFNIDETAQALEESGVMSEGAALRWIDSPERAEFSIDDLTDEIRDYAEASAAENNGQFRLLFMVDEIGQYIGKDTNLMLNLQSIVEELGTKCRGRVWVIVTSQEAIDEVTTVAGNDFSKIQGRFATRLSLSGSCADEVIKRRILAKTPDATALLKERYGAWEPQLKNLFALRDATADLVGYRGAEDFAQSFPFAGYQFKLLQKVMSELRKQGSSGKHLSSQERSMLSGFKETAQAVKERDENTIVPFWRFYDTLQTFLESYHRVVINRAADAAARGEGLEQHDVDVLKLLFLLRWVDRDIATTLDNIVALMTDRIESDRLALREQVQASLDRLMKQNYVTRNGERYQFLTDEEQEVAQEIRRIHPSTAKLVGKASDIVFDGIFTATKLSVGKNNLPVDRYLDGAIRGTAQRGLALNVIAGMDGGTPLSHDELIMRSMREQEAIVVLCPEVGYQSCLHEAACIEQYAGTVATTQLNETKQRIVRGKQQERNALEKRAAELIEQAIKRADFYVKGSSFTPSQSNSAKRIIEQCLEQLVQDSYPYLDHIDKNYDSDTQIQQILNGTERALPGQQPNVRAIEDVKHALTLRATQHQGVSMKDLQAQYRAKPYGWREYDIAAVVAELVASKQAKILYADKAVDPQERTCAALLRERNKIDKVVIELRRKASAGDCTTARRCVEELCRATDLPVEEDALAHRCIELLCAKRDELKGLLEGAYARNRSYPGYGTTADAKRLLDELLAVGADPADVLAAIAKKRNDLEDAAEDLADVLEFFANQREVFDRADQLSRRMHDDADCLLGEPEAQEALATIDEILAMPAPYARVRELPEAAQRVESAHKRLLKERKEEIVRQVEEMFDDIEAYAASCQVSLSSIGQAHAKHKNAAHTAERLADLDAIPTRLGKDQTRLYAEIDREHERVRKPRPANTDVMVTLCHEEDVAHVTGASERPAACGLEAEAAPAGEVTGALAASGSVPASGAAVGSAARAAHVATAGGTAGSSASAAAPTPAAPTPEAQPRLVSRRKLFAPWNLSTAEDIDAYLAQVRVRLLDELKTGGPIRISE